MNPVLQEVLLEDLRDLYGTEKEQLEILKTLTESASERGLQESFQRHMESTQAQIGRLERIFESIGEEAEGEPPQAVVGMVEDIEGKSGRDADNELIDLELIAAARKMEHFEIACYTAARDMAKAIGLDDAVKLIDETLKEEEMSDQHLSRLSAPLLQRAAEAEDEVEAEEEASGELEIEGEEGDDKHMTA